MGQQTSCVQSNSNPDPVNPPCDSSLNELRSALEERRDNVRNSAAIKQRCKSENFLTSGRNKVELPATSPISMGRKQSDGPSTMHKMFKRQASVKVGPDYHANMRNASSTGDILTGGCKIPHLLLFTGTVKPIPYQECEAAIDYISSLQLYNSMSDGQLSPYRFDPESLLIVDVRTAQEFDSLHINTAYHINAIERGDAKALEEYGTIVLYDVGGEPARSGDSVLGSAIRRLKEKNGNTSALRGGFEAFRGKHPYLCSSDVVSSERDRQRLIGDYPSLVLEDQLYLGRADQATNSLVIADLMVSHVLSVAAECPPPAADDQLQRLQIGVMDDGSADLLSELPEAIVFMDKALKENGRVLVHCVLGVSRSSAVVIAYLMHVRRWTLQDAYAFLRTIRPIVQPNNNFMEQLLLYEEMLFGHRLSNVSDWLCSDSE